MIKPTVGRIVWFYRGDEDTNPPQAAIITHVWGDRCVNLCVWREDGRPDPAPSIMLIQDDDLIPDHQHCTWMPYQVGQAKQKA